MPRGVLVVNVLDIEVLLWGVSLICISYCVRFVSRRVRVRLERGGGAGKGSGCARVFLAFVAHLRISRAGLDMSLISFHWPIVESPLMTAMILSSASLSSIIRKPPMGLKGK